MLQLLKSHFFSLSISSFHIQFKDPTQCWSYLKFSVSSTIFQEDPISSTKLLILFGVECVFVFHTLALTFLWWISFVFSVAGQVKSCVHQDRGASGRWSWDLYCGGGAAFRSAVVNHPGRKRGGKNECIKMWTDTDKHNAYERGDVS